jgi:hypothetical protein
MADDWRIRIRFPAQEHAHGLLHRLRSELHGETGELAKELEKRRLVATHDEDDVFVYAGARAEAEAARTVVESLVREHELEAEVGPVEQWLPDEERWDHEAQEDEDVDEDLLERGFAPWQVRIESDTHEEAVELADRLEQEGWGITRRWKYVVAGVESEDEARELAKRFHGEVEIGGELLWETLPGNPFAVFGGLGSTGAPF